MSELISRQAAIERLKKHRKVFCKNHMEFTILSDKDKARVDEIDNAIATLVNLPSAQPEQRWIPCSERLPEESGRYLVSVLDGVGRRTTVAPYQPRYKAWTMTGRMAYWKVIAWMPLPESYRGANE